MKFESKQFYNNIKKKKNLLHFPPSFYFVKMRFHNNFLVYMVRVLREKNFHSSFAKTSFGGRILHGDKNYQLKLLALDWLFLIYLSFHPILVQYLLS